MDYAPLISVVIPTYNREDQLSAALDSVLAQTYPNFEVIVVDDGSVDGTGAKMQRIIPQESARTQEIRYFLQSNQGSSAARNKGIAEARGEWIAFLDSDDVWYPEKLAWQVRAIEAFKDTCGACFTDARLVSDSGLDATSFQSTNRAYDQPIGVASNLLDRLASSFDHIWLTCLLVRTDLARKIGGFDPKISFCEDHDFNFRLSLVTSYCYVNKPLAQLDRSPAPVTTRPWEKAEVRLVNKQAMLEKWLKLDTLPPSVRRTVAGILGQTHSAWGNWYLETGRDAEAPRAIAKAIRLQPTGALVVKWVLARVAPAFARKLMPKAKAYTA